MHKEGEIFTDFDKIRKEIEDDTDRVAGPQKGVVEEPINLKIFSSRVVNLTLVDLPGMTKVPLEGQPDDIEDQIKNLMMKYISNTNSIILAVTAANTDIATSEALKYAKEVDPDGDRTLAVFTKLDIMDEGTNAAEILHGKAIPVKLGIIGVVNRSQQAIIDKKEIEEQLEKEAKFLKSRYPELAAKNGTPYLGKMLSELLMNHIRECLPGLKEQVKIKMTSWKKTLELYGKAVVDDQNALIEIITKFSNSYCATIDGAPTSNNCGETRLYKIIHEDFRESIEFIEPSVILMNSKELAGGIGQKPTLFNTPSFDGPFESILKQEIVKQLLDPAMECIEMIRSEMQRVIDNCGEEMQMELERFPRLRQKIRETVTNLLNSRIRITELNIENMVKVETAYINKSHPDFDKAAVLAAKMLNDDPETSMNCSGFVHTLLNIGRELSDDEKKEILMELIRAYFFIVRKSIQDLTPKTIMHFLVNFVKEKLQSCLLQTILNSENAEELMQESNDISVKRKEAKAMLDVSMKGKFPNSF